MTKLAGKRIAKFYSLSHFAVSAKLLIGLHRRVTGTSRIFWFPEILNAVPIKSIRRSQVTGLRNLTKGHRGHSKNRPKPPPKWSKNRKFSYKLPSKIFNIVI